MKQTSTCLCVCYYLSTLFEGQHLKQEEEGGRADLEACFYAIPTGSQVEWSRVQARLELLTKRLFQCLKGVCVPELGDLAEQYYRILSLYPWALYDSCAKLPEDLHALCIEVPYLEENPVRLSRFRSWECNSAVPCKHCDNRFGPALTAMIVELLPRCSMVRNNISSGPAYVGWHLHT